MAQENGWFSKFRYLELVLAKDESNKTLLERHKWDEKPCEAVANSVSFQIIFILQF